MATESPYNLGVEAYKTKNYKEAAVQWSKAVAQGNVSAMNNLGYLLYYGYGTNKDPETAIDLWRVASYSGHSESQWHLGNAFETGIGIEKDLAKAYAWYRCSVENASSKLRVKEDDTEQAILEDAQESLSKLTLKLAGKELKRGQQLAVEYIDRYGRPAP